MLGGLSPVWSSDLAERGQQGTSLAVTAPGSPCAEQWELLKESKPPDPGHAQAPCSPLPAAGQPFWLLSAP